MIEYNVEPWPSTYKMIGDVKPRYLTSRFGREVAAMRVAIPARTIEPVQIHLNCERDNQPFEEVLADFDMPFHVALLDIRTGRTKLRQYSRGEKIIIPEFIPHWLMNNNATALEFTCEYAPHPWDGEKDEPEFREVNSLLNFINKKDLTKIVSEACRLAFD